MNKTIAKTIPVLELILSLIAYFAVAYQFENDPVIMEILPDSDFMATLLRLSIYIVPGINIISGLFGITFNTKGILCFAAVLELLAGVLTLFYQGRSLLMNVLGIVMIVFAVLFLVSVLSLHQRKVRRS